MVFRFLTANRSVSGSLTTATTVLCTLAGCTVGPNFSKPHPPVTSSFNQTAAMRTASAPVEQGGTQQLVENRDIPGDWWTVFHSPALTSMVTRALAANPDLTAAQATLRQARQNQRAEQGALFPQISASASSERQRESLAAVGFGAGSSTYTVNSASLSVSYTLDAFGGVRRQIEQLGAQADYQRYELEATALTLAADVVTSAITAASLQAQIDTTRDIIRSYTAALDLTRRRFELGGVSQSDVLQQQSLLDAQAATLPGLQKQLEQTRNQLAIYLGATPGAVDLPAVDLASLTLPDELPLSLPSRLVEQRPDIQAYAALLHAATAQVGVATANMLPQITLSGSYGRDGSTLSNVFTPAGIVWTIASSITQPIFEGGSLRAKKQAAIAAMDVAAAQYSSTVNTAFQSVANALVAIQRDAETVQAAAAAERTAAASLTVAKAQYQAGAGAYLNVLTAEQSDQSARLTLVSARAARLTDTAALFQALGGGWWNRDTERMAQCCGVSP